MCPEGRLQVLLRSHGQDQSAQLQPGTEVHPNHSGFRATQEL